MTSAMYATVVLFLSGFLFPTFLYHHCLPRMAQLKASLPRRFLLLYLPALLLCLLPRYLSEPAAGLGSSSAALFSSRCSSVAAQLNCLLKLTDLVLGHTERSVLSSYTRFMLHWLLPCPLSFRTDEKADAVAENAAGRPKEPISTAKEASVREGQRERSQYVQVRRRALRPLLLSVCCYLAAVTLSAVILTLHEHYPQLVAGQSLLSSLLFCCLLYCGCNASCNLVQGVAMLLHGDGVSVRDVFGPVLSSTDLAAFWRHWNRSTQRFLYRAVFKPCGGRQRYVLSVLAVGAVSGLMHGTPRTAAAPAHADGRDAQ